MSLSQTGEVTAPRPCPLRSGELFGRVSGPAMREEYLFHLVDWIAGERCESPEAFLIPERLRSIGGVVARLHDHARAPASTRIRGLPVLDEEWLIGRLSCLSSHRLAGLLDRERVAALRARMHALCRALQGLGHEEDAFGIIHGDLGPHNWVFRGEEPRPIDFAECSLGFFLYDLAGVVWSFAGREGFHEARGALLEGYAPSIALRQELEARMDWFHTAYTLGWLNWVLAQSGTPSYGGLAEHVPDVVDRMV